MTEKARSQVEVEAGSDAKGNCEETIGQYAALLAGAEADEPVDLRSSNGIVTATVPFNAPYADQAVELVRAEGEWRIDSAVDRE